MGLYEIEAKETKYRETLFRSRLEARWAMFFDLMKIKWTYEPEIFDLLTGKYIPDFYIETLGVFAEVKPDWQHATQEVVSECCALSEFSGKAVLILDGPPDYRGYRICTKYGIYPDIYACITLKKLTGDMDSCILALGKDVEYKRAVLQARGHHFEQTD